MNITSKVNKLDGLKRSVVITVNKDEYLAAFSKDLNKYKSTVKIDGFRSGKVPEKIILKNYRDRIHGDALNKIIEASLKQSLESNKLETASPPQLSIDKEPSAENDLVFTAEFEIYPLFVIKNIEEISIDVPEVIIDKDDIDAVISNIQKQNIKWEEKKDKAATGDKIIMEYEGLISGKEFDNNKHENFTFIIDDKINGDPATVGLYKEFYKNSIGEDINVEKSFSYKMPDDFLDKNIAGKTIDYKMKIKHIYKGDLPELNDEFYKKFGTENSSVDIFRENVKKHMNLELEQKIKSITSAAINEKLLDVNDFEIPTYMLQSEVKHITTQYQGMTQNLDDKIKLELDQIARKRVKLNLIYMKITEDNNITVSQDDVYDYISKSDPATQEQLATKIKEDKNYLNHIKNKVLEDAIMNLIESKCKKNKLQKKFSEVVN